MVKLNMANMNTLFKKGYLLAGVMMAANMFVVNEVKASGMGNTGTYQEGQGMGEQFQKKENLINDTFNKTDDFNNKDKGTEDHKKKQGPLDKLLSCENYLNLFGTLALSGANNYFKWWDYNAGGYLNLRIGCLGWRTKKFFDIVQLDFNLNLWRGIGWLIPHIISRRSLTKAEKTNLEDKEESQEGTENISGSNASLWVSFLFKDILRGFVSAPLTFHISNFSISISLDSILWEFVKGRFFDEDKNNEGKKIQLDFSDQMKEKL